MFVCKSLSPYAILPRGIMCLSPRAFFYCSFIMVVYHYALTLLSVRAKISLPSLCLPAWLPLPWLVQYSLRQWRVKNETKNNKLTKKENFKLTKKTMTNKKIYIHETLLATFWLTDELFTKPSPFQSTDRCIDQFHKNTLQFKLYTLQTHSLIAVIRGYFA